MLHSNNARGVPCSYVSFCISVYVRESVLILILCRIVLMSIVVFHGISPNQRLAAATIQRLWEKTFS